MSRTFIKEAWLQWWCCFRPSSVSHCFVIWKNTMCAIRKYPWWSFRKIVEETGCAGLEAGWSSSVCYPYSQSSLLCRLCRTGRIRLDFPWSISGLYFRMQVWWEYTKTRCMWHFWQLFSEHWPHMEVHWSPRRKVRWLWIPNRWRQKILICQSPSKIWQIRNIRARLLLQILRPLPLHGFWSRDWFQNMEKRKQKKFSQIFMQMQEIIWKSLVQDL